MIISISKSRSPEGWAHKHFNRVELRTITQFCRAITAEHWAGILWKDDARKADNFESCELCVLDFDDGKVTIDQFATRMRELEYWFILGPSKSHQKMKNGKICDRFRAVLRFSEVIKDADQYRQNMKRIQKLFFSDWQATGPHMKFAPCTSIYDLVVEPNAKKLNVHAKRNYPVYKTSDDYVTNTDKTVPLWVNQMLSSADSGQRNISVYKAARTLKKKQFSEGETITIVRASGISLEEKEIKNTVHSAFKK